MMLVVTQYSGTILASLRRKNSAGLAPKESLGRVHHDEAGDHEKQVDPGAAEFTPGQ
jgi:hypothetical protein